MSFEFVKHENYPDDQYIKEACYLAFEGKYRVCYVRKKMQNGGLFWSPISTGVAKNGQKTYLQAFALDSKFLEDDIKAFLEGRSWENRVQGNTISKDAETDGLPF